MSGMDVALLFYSGILGGLLGATIVSIALKRNQEELMKLIQFYWNQDIKEINHKIEELLSTDFVDK